MADTENVPESEAMMPAAVSKLKGEEMFPKNDAVTGCSEHLLHVRPGSGGHHPPSPLEGDNGSWWAALLGAWHVWVCWLRLQGHVQSSWGLPGGGAFAGGPS